MLIRDVMSTNVVTVSSSTSMADARRIMEAHRIRRLPVVDKGKLVGLVTRQTLDRSGPSQLTTFSIHELSYLLSKITVHQVMSTEPITISPEATVEEGIALAQSHKIGALLVVEEGRLVGIATTNDFFYKLLNPALGIGQPGSRVGLRGCCQTKQIKEALEAVGRGGGEITGVFMMTYPDDGRQDLVIHLKQEDPSPVVAELTRAGYDVEKRAR